MTDLAQVRLKDGRTLAYAECGARGGVPVLHFHGLPSCRLEYRAVDTDVLGRAGVRLICIDRPGFGRSSRQPGRRVIDWPADVAQLADILGLEQFAVSGYSAGGPFALACARAMPDRLLGVGVLGGSAPRQAPGGHRVLSRTDRLTFPLARYAPPLASGLWLLGRRQARRSPAQFRRELAKDFPASPDRAALEGPIGPAIREVFLEAVRDGVGGIVDDYRAVGSDWGFALAGIEPRVRWVHGALDATVPLEHGRWTADQIPGAELVVVADQGHLLASERFIGLWCGVAGISHACA